MIEQTVLLFAGVGFPLLTYIRRRYAALGIPIGVASLAMYVSSFGYDINTLMIALAVVGAALRYFF